MMKFNGIPNTYVLPQNDDEHLRVYALELVDHAGSINIDEALQYYTPCYYGQDTFREAFMYLMGTGKIDIIERPRPLADVLIRKTASKH